ncbi:MAG: putative Ig domain-containing protein [Acidobacteria bacterium]|nr:putative Ig domain-containing protein [Acidobacteriota bacterium]MBI3422718.1 putative Ig domain-containing protein [Acidobacteriota bacterium]
MQRRMTTLLLTLTGVFGLALWSSSAQVRTGQASRFNWIDKINLPAAHSELATVALLANTITVTTNTDGGGSCPGGNCTLRQAIFSAQSGDTIAFDATFFAQPRTITLSGAELLINKNLTITGTGANKLTLTGNQASRVFTISSGATVALSGMTISGGNGAGSLANGAGGGIYNEGVLTVTGCHLTANTGAPGGGINNQGTVALLGSTLSNNRGNGSTGGGGIYNAGALSVTNSTISGNQADNSLAGGGIATTSGTVTLTNSTIVTNAGNLVCSGGTVRVRNTIIAANATGSEDLWDLTHSIVSDGYNLIGNPNFAASFTAAKNDLTGSNDGSSVLDPRIYPLGDYGGTTPTHALRPNSLALDWLRLSANGNGAPATDQRGFTRPFGAGADIGAFEFLPMVSNANDSGPGSLRQAVADSAVDGYVFFDPDFFAAAPRTIALTSGEIVLSKNLTLAGLGNPNISGNNTSRVFSINPSVTASLNGLTVSGGNGVGSANSGQGGGILNRSTLTLTNCYLTGNTASTGGGIANRGSLTILNSTIANNAANGSDAGGGIENDTLMTVTNSTISGNRATSNSGANGGGIRSNFSVNLTHCTITDNAAAGASSASGLLNAGGLMLVRNTIIAANQNNSTIPDLRDPGGAPAPSGGFNLIGNPGNVTAFNYTGDQTGNSTAPLDPKLGPLQSNGGITLNKTPLPGSPALDRGYSFGSITDQRGRQRAYDNPTVPNASGGDGSDIGAVETRLLTVTKTADTNDGACDGDCSLREAIAAAAAGDAIQFSALFNTPQTITLGGSELSIQTTLMVMGPGADKLTVSGNRASIVFWIRAGVTSLSGMTISGGSTGFQGGGIWNQSNLTVTNCHITGNRAALGGGIYNSAVVTLDGSTVSNNTAYGNHTAGGIQNEGTLSLTNSTISGNQVLLNGNNGDGIRSNGTATITNSTITDNLNASGNCCASGIYVTGGTMAVRNTIIAANRNNAALPDVADSNGTGFSSGGYNLIGNRGNVTAFNQVNDQTGNSAAPLNPQLAPLALNGGTTPTHALLTGSPALDKGNSFGSTTDQRGVARPFDLSGSAPATGGDNADIGAFELNGASHLPLLVNAQPGLTRQQSSASNSVIALVNAFESGAQGVTVTVTSANPSNGVTVSNIVRTGDTVTADLVAACGAANASFTLTAQDNAGHAATAILSVGVTANTAPTLSYNNPPLLLTGTGTTLNPATGPGDNGSVVSIVVQSSGTFTGTAAVNNTTGIVTLGNANSGTHTITIRATDNCGATTDATFQVSACPSRTVTNTNGSGAGSLRQAIADVCPGGTINFDPAYFNQPRIIALGGAELVIAKDLTIIGPGADKLTISGNHASRVLNIPYNYPAAYTVSISGVTLTDGNADSGGAIFQEFGTLSLDDCVIANNTAGSAGGGIESAGTVNLTNSVITNNTAQATGGGIHSNGTLTVQRSTISNNTAAGSVAGGGIDGYSLSLINSTVSGNRVTGSGDTNAGGILAQIDLTITHSTITNNVAVGAGSAGGVLFYLESATVRNSIIAGNQNNTVIPDIADGNGGISSQGYNLIGNRGSVTAFNQPGDQTGTAAAPLNPQLGPLQNNGGFTPTHALLTGSPALDQGKSFNVTTDQRGQTRPFDQPGTANANSGDGSDIGAVEMQALPAPCPTLTLSPGALSAGLPGVPYTQTFTASGGSGPYSFTVSGTLPPGLTLTNGTLQGTPSTAGTFNFTLTATDANHCTGMQSYALTINCLNVIVSPASLPGGLIGAAYSQQLTAAYDELPARPARFASTTGFTFSLLSGTLPQGLTLTADGLLAGTLTTTGAFNFTVKATDGSNGCAGTQAYSLTITCPTLTLSPATLPNPQPGVAYNQTLSVQPAGGSYSFTISSGTLPQGLSLSAAGALTGTTTQTGTFNFRFTVTSFGGQCSGFRDYQLTVGCPVITLSDVLTNAQPGAAYNQTINVTPSGSYTFSLAGGGLPSGVTINAQTGALTGTLQQAGTFNFTIKALNTNGCQGTRAYTVAVNCPSFTLSSLPNGVAGVPYNQTLTVTPSGTYSYALAGGTLPSGLSLGNDGSLTGTPSAAGSFNFTVKAQSANGCLATQAYAVSISCPTITINPASLPGGVVGTAYSQTVSASPAGSSSYSVSSGALPTGLTLNAATGVISGVPSTGGTFSFRVAAAAGSCSGARDYTVVMACAGLTITTATLPAGTAGTAYAQTIGVSPADSYSFALLTGSLPSGLTLNAVTGVLGGLPSVTGSYNFTLKAQTANGCAATQSYTLVVGCPSITLAALPPPVLNTAYDQTVSVLPSGGGYSFAVTAGALPAGLALNAATGVISGMPTISSGGGAYNFTLTAASFGACTGSRLYSGTIVGSTCPMITLPASLPNGQPGQLYSQAVAATPSGSYSYAMTAGALPAGLTFIAAAGLLYGYPAAAGAFNFTIKATDANNCSGQRAYTLNIGSAAAALALQADYDGDGKADPTLWSANEGVWRILKSTTQQAVNQTWGTAGDVTLLGDYDGDGKTDLAVFRPADATFYVKRSSDGGFLIKQWGLATDVPVPGDYDGDGKTDIAVWRGSTGVWYILYSGRSSDGMVDAVTWGASAAPYNDVPVPGDYDGDGKSDVAVFRRGTGTWLVKRSSDGQYLVKQWGLGTDVPVANDYDGDGKTDLAVWRGTNGTWYIWQSATNDYRVTLWGMAGDQTAAGDYDGDGKADIAVWRGGEANWYIACSRDSSLRQLGQGRSGDTPVSPKL